MIIINFFLCVFLYIKNCLKDKTIPIIFWRRERDSNPWCDFSHTAFPGLHLKPLGHLCKKV